MDPLSITTSATAILAICLQAVHLIQKTIETVKNARKILIRLLGQTERLRLILEQLRCLTKQLGSRGGLLLSYNDSGPKLTIRELNDLVKSISGKKNFVGIQMLLNQGKVDNLVGKLKKHEEEVVTLLLSIASASAVRTENEILRMHEESKAQSEVLSLFEDFCIGRNSLNQAQPIKTVQVWFGDTYREGFDDDYLALRDRLSDAAYIGDFDTVFEVFGLAEQKYGESWINAPRLSHNVAQTSGWAPIHQAIFMGATNAVVQRLINLGASRTLRTNWADPAEFEHTDLTALEIAHEHGQLHLFEILAPTIRHPAPYSALKKVQQLFHDLIRSDLEPFKNQEHLLLPDLMVLTELDVPEMWFPLKVFEGMASTSPRGYLYHLDRRELVVKAYSIQKADDAQLYRISTDGVMEIIEGVVFGSASVSEKRG